MIEHEWPQSGHNTPLYSSCSCSTSMEEFVYTGRGQHVPKNVVSVRFHPSVTKAEDKAFDNCHMLKEVVFNEGLKTIGNRGVFYGCSSLQRITMPSTLTEIGVDAFWRCSSLQEVVFNEGLKKIEHCSFSDCISLQSTTFPSSLTEIGGGAFCRCSNLREVVFNEGLEKIGIEAFKECSSLEITIPSTVVDIGMAAFEFCSNLREVELHEGLQKIGRGAFGHCSSLERFTFPSISTRLNNVVEVETEVNRTRRLNDIDTIRGDMIGRRDTELFVPGAVLRGSSNWNTIKASLDQIVSWIKYHEIKEATTLFELALWKTKLDQADGATDINREAYRIEVPGPVKDAILQYLW